MSDQTNKKNEWAEREVGALWKKQSSTQKYLSGHIRMDDGMGGEETLQVVIFNNKHKNKDNHPDFRIYKSLPQAQSTTSSQVSSSEEETTAVVSGVQEVSEEDVL
jgi:uncharacterized protein (DUF736 family)